MASAENSLLGLAKQTAEGTPNTTDADYIYALFNRGGAGPNNIMGELDPEVGGGALSRGQYKLGVNIGGGMELVPRTEIIGALLHGFLDNITSTVQEVSEYYQHVLKLGTDEFAAPFFTVRTAPGQLWGEQLQDVRVSQLSLDWRGSDFLRATVGLLGGLPAKDSGYASWTLTTPDETPPFLTPRGAVELPTATNAKCLRGSIVMGSAIPLDEQYVVGTYTPEGLDIVGKTVIINMILKVEDDTLYTKMAYDPAAGTAWVADVFKEGDINLYFESDREINPGGLGGVYDSVKITANATADNIHWAVQPINLRARRNVTMAVTGILTAYSGGDPITVTLDNERSSYWGS